MYKVFYFNPLRVCTYLVSGSGGRCVIIDPGAMTLREHQRLEEAVTSAGLDPVAILLTHGHFDHVLGLQMAVEQWDVPVYMNSADRAVFESSVGICRELGLPYQPYDGPREELSEGELALPGGLTFEVIHTPGHTQGGVCFYKKDEGLLFCGDTIFQGSVGRTDHPGGNFEQLIDSIKQKILTLPAATRLLPGHGYDTTVEEETATNPFID